MTQAPRILTIMGSGETSPTMVKTHRENIAKLGKSNPISMILDTPFGFQGNADDIASKAIEYFKVSVNIDTEIASFRSKKLDVLATEKFLSTIDRADFIFSGPGSPTYALKQWRETQFSKILENKLTNGPCVITFSSAAALTLGSHTIPVYEIYKVGDEPEWIEGLDLLGSIGIHGALIPHFNNAEGGNHDTRFCYLGQSRLEIMESQLKENESVFGIDEHTAIVIDLDNKMVKVTGNGTFNIRNQGRQVSFESGAELPLLALQDTESLFTSSSVITQISPISSEADTIPTSSESATHKGVSPLVVKTGELRQQFELALDEKNTDAAVKAILSLLSEIDLWENETFQADEMTQAKSSLRTMVVRLGEFALRGAKEPEEIFGPFVDMAIEVRLRAREEKRWAESDQIRDELSKLGIEVRDIPGGSEWISIGNQ